MRTASNAKENSATFIIPDIIPSSPWRVASATALPGYRIRVRFLDGLEGMVDMSGLIHSATAGIFAELVDAERFEALYVECGAVTWPGGQDLAPDAMHEAIKQMGHGYCHDHFAEATEPASRRIRAVSSNTRL